MTDVLFNPEEYVKGFSREQIVDHLREVISIVTDLDPPLDLRDQVFGVAQAMHATMQKRESPVTKAPPLLRVPKER